MGSVDSFLLCPTETYIVDNFNVYTKCGDMDLVRSWASGRVRSPYKPRNCATATRPPSRPWSAKPPPSYSQSFIRLRERLCAPQRSA